MKKLMSILFLVLISLSATGQELAFDNVALSDSTALNISMQNLAKEYLQQNKAEGLEIEANDRYMIEILAGNYEASIKTIESLRENSDLNHGHPRYMPYELFSKAKIEQLASIRVLTKFISQSLKLI